MRRGRFIAGLVLLIIGLLVLGVGVAVNSQKVAQTVPAGAGLTLSTTALTSVSADISWSAAASTTQVYLTSGTPSCAAPSGVVASGTGASGSFSASLSPGTSYVVYACNGGAFEAAILSYTVSGGFTWGDLIGIVLLLFGVLLIVLGLRGGERSGRVREWNPGMEDVVPAAPARMTPPTAPAMPAPPVAQAPTPVSVGGRTRIGCTGCGKTYPIGQYTTCPACGTALR